MKEDDGNIIEIKDGISAIETDGPYIDIRMKSPTYPRMPEQLMGLANIFGESQYETERDKVAQELGWSVAKVERGIDQLIGESTRPKAPVIQIDAPPTPEVAPEIAELAEFAGNDAEYETRRKAVAKTLGWRVGKVDRAVKRLAAQDNESQGRAFTFEDLDPWPEPILTGAMLDEVISLLGRFVILKRQQIVAVALWIMFTYVFNECRACPILAITSAIKRCGKTTLLTVLLKLCHKPIPASNITPPAIFRTIDEHAPTLIIDEADTFLTYNEETRGLLNCGHTREFAYTVRLVGDSYVPTHFSTWCPKVVALIGALKDTILDRSIHIKMHRKTRAESVESLEDFDGFDTRRRLIRWASDARERVRAGRPETPEALNDRARLNWQQLLKIAELDGGKYMKEANQAALYVTDSELDDEKIVQLLWDIREIYETKRCDHLTSRALCDALADIEDHQWVAYGRSEKPISQWQLATLLKGAEVRPTVQRFEHGTSRGYRLSSFEDAFKRCLPARAEGGTPPQTVTPKQSNGGAASSGILTVTRKSDVTVENGPKPARDNRCYGVTVQNGPQGGSRVCFPRDVVLKVLAPFCEGHGITAEEVLEHYPPADYEALATDPELARWVVGKVADQLKTQGQDDEPF